MTPSGSLKCGLFSVGALVGLPRYLSAYFRLWFGLGFWGTPGTQAHLAGTPFTLRTAKPTPDLFI